MYDKLGEISKIINEYGHIWVLFEQIARMKFQTAPSPPHTQTSRTPMIKLADEVLARRTDGQIIGRLMQNIPML